MSTYDQTLIVGRMRCRGCSYDLRGLPENRCPECGTPFDPNDTETFIAVGAEVGKRFLGASVYAASIIVLMIPTMAIALVMGYWHPPLKLVAIAAAFVAMLVCVVDLCIFVASVIALVAYCSKPYEKGELKLAMLISFLVPLVCSVLLLWFLSLSLF